MKNPFKIIYNDFAKFNRATFDRRGYATHALVGALFAFVPLYIPIKVALIFLLGCLWEIMRLQTKGITPDYADARWGAYFCLIFSLLVLWIG
jgi:hypothetical protein